MSDVLKIIQDVGLVPVVKIDNAADAVPLGRALIDGGLPIIEITFRTEAAEEAIGNISRDLPEMLIGAGTVLSVEQVKKAVNAGAKFIVSPGFNPDVVEYCIKNNIPITPGVNSPTQIEQALKMGLHIVKYFPAEASGGFPMLKALAAPYVNMKFIPTGGINQSNLNTYLKAGFVYACGGSWMVEASLISSGKFDIIQKLVREAVLLSLGFELAHLGINGDNEKEAEESAELICMLFGFDKKVGNSSIFAGKSFEIMKSPYLGKYGHIAIGVNNINRGIAYLKGKGIGIKQDTAKDKNGKLIAVYLDREIAGFAIHLLQK